MGLMLPLTIIAITLILLTGIALGTYGYLLKRGWPRLNIEIPPVQVVVDLTQAIPSPLLVQVQFQAVPANMPLKLPEEVMPVDVFTYVNQESEEHARVSRGQYARRLRHDLGSWELALAQLKSEDK